jgi:hypothetical protein
METAIIEVADSLAIYREQVKNEQSNKPSMSEAAAQKLRAINEAERLDKIANGRFCTALKSVIVNEENLTKLIIRCHTTPPLDQRGWLDGAYRYHKVTDVLSSEQQLSRMVHKLNWFISAGYKLGREIDSISLINYFSALTESEAYMSDSAFAAQWTAKDAAAKRQYRLDHGIIEADTTEPVYRPCKSGKKCLRFEKRKPAPAAGKGEYCSTACAASDRARQKRALAAMAASPIQ